MAVSLAAVPGPSVRCGEEAESGLLGGAHGLQFGDSSGATGGNGASCGHGQIRPAAGESGVELLGQALLCEGELVQPYPAGMQDRVQT